MTPIFTSVRLPKKWFNSDLDINVSITAFVSVVDDTWSIRMHSISYPGWSSASFDNRYKQDLYELVEQGCMEKYAQEKLKQEDYVL
jgi:hypothetical protein